MQGDPEAINKQCQEFWDRATGINQEFQDEGRQDARYELKEAMDEIWADICDNGWSIEDAMSAYLERREW